MDGMVLVSKVLASCLMSSVLAPGLGFQNAVPLGPPPRLELYMSGIPGILGDSEQTDTRDQSRSTVGVASKRPKSRAVSANEAQRILKKTKHSLDPELSRQTLFQAFDLADGGVLLLFDEGNGRLYESKS